MGRTFDNLSDMGMRMGAVARPYWWIVWVILSPVACCVSNTYYNNYFFLAKLSLLTFFY